MNLSELIAMNGSAEMLTEPVKMMDLVVNWCTQIDYKVMYLALFVLTMYIFRMVMLPRARECYNELLPKYKRTINRMLNVVGDYADTFGFISANVIIYAVYVQYRSVIPSHVYVWYSIVMGVLFLSCVANVIMFFRNRRRGR